MNKRSGGITALIGGLIWSGFNLWYITSGAGLSKLMTTLWVLIPAVFCLSWTLWVLSKSERSKGSRIGLLISVTGLGLLSCGLIGTSVLGIGSAWLIGILGELVLSIGLLLFGLTNLRERLLPIFNGLPLLISLIYIPSWMVDPGALPAFFSRDITEWLAVLVGVGWMLFGGLLLLDRRE